MHPKISVAVPTRHRPECMDRFLQSYHETVGYMPVDRTPHLTVLLDSPTRSSMPKKWKVNARIQTIELFEKSSLTELWNWSVITSPTDWVLICNDDIVFKHGWLEYLEEQVASNKYLQINLGHYGAFCMHKSLILRLGWHDERYRGGGYEDIDWQLRLNEAGLKDSVDASHDFYQNRPGHDIGSFIDHFKSPNNEGWQGSNNEQWICHKWGRPSPSRWNNIPSIRTIANIDWHPSHTKRYEKRFMQRASFDLHKPHMKEVYP